MQNSDIECALGAAVFDVALYLVFAHRFYCGGPLYLPASIFATRLAGQHRKLPVCQWLKLLRPFPALRNLYLSKAFAPCIAPALVGRRMTKVQPRVHNIFLEELESSGPVQEVLRQAISMRRLTRHPIAVFFLGQRFGARNV